MPIEEVASLKKLAKQMFKRSLLSQVQEAIEKDEQQPASTRRGARAFSIGTFWAGDRLYNRLGVGEFQGRISLIWNGMDSFVFVPDPDHPFSYTTSASFKYPNWKIEPKLMDTDGGSIPQVLRGLSQFSSWGYAPAFLIHDWIFTAHKCQFPPDDTWKFDDTAEVMAEAIKTLMVKGFTNVDGEIQILEKAEDTLYLMYQAVASPIARNLYNDTSTVSCRDKLLP